MRPVLLCALVAAAYAVALPAAAQVYRWVDERGVVNYTSLRPPAGVQVTRLDTHASRNNAISESVHGPALPPLPPPAASAPPGDVDRATVEAVGRTLALRHRAPQVAVATPPDASRQLADLQAP